MALGSAAPWWVKRCDDSGFIITIILIITIKECGLIYIALICRPTSNIVSGFMICLTSRLYLTPGQVSLWPHDVTGQMLKVAMFPVFLL